MARPVPDLHRRHGYLASVRARRLNLRPPGRAVRAASVALSSKDQDQ